MPKRAIVLASGGLDSTTIMALINHKGYDIYALTFDYGQRHKIELKAAQKVAKYFGAKKHLILHIELGAIGGSALTEDIPVPQGRKLKEISSSGIPITYVPARNTIFLAYALSWAEVLEATDIFIGVNTIDFSNYPDCRPEFIESFQRTANVATKTGVEGKGIRINVPLIDMTKGEIIKKGISLGVDYSMTHSCYNPKKDGLPCGKCDSCLLRKKGFEEAGVKDPLLTGTNLYSKN
ncbi:MAG: 7-cyano-7-deazaguanine synthase QueC [Deltaproteobacteria bacterium]|nr:7-cyano-7-deazaguanine synthase QueC [Deltaproteobacteria bacterium]